jgi:DNA invertase Pin-like site-specific DNA recombinase
MMNKTLGYARIPTGKEQDVSSQKAMLEELGAIVVFIEISNGSSLQGRDQLEAAIRVLDDGDTLIALHPNQIAHDAADFLNIAKRVVEKRAVLKINDPVMILDGSDMMGEALLKILGLVGSINKHFAQVLHRRNIEVAKLREVYRDCPTLIDPSKVRQLRDAGMKPAAIARQLRIGRETVYRALAV